MPSKNIRSENFLTKPRLKLQLRLSKKLQINVPTYGFKILINPGALQRGTSSNLKIERSSLQEVHQM